MNERTDPTDVLEIMEKMNDNNDNTPGYELEATDPNPHNYDLSNGLEESKHFLSIILF